MSAGGTSAAGGAGGGSSSNTGGTGGRRIPVGVGGMSAGGQGGVAGAAARPAAPARRAARAQAQRNRGPRRGGRCGDGCSGSSGQAGIAGGDEARRRVGIAGIVRASGAGAGCAARSVRRDRNVPSFEAELGRKVAINHNFVGWTDDYTTMLSGLAAGWPHPARTWEAWENSVGAPLTRHHRRDLRFDDHARAQAVKASARSSSCAGATR